MSEPILMALVQLFALVAASVKRKVSENTRKILESYLRQHLNMQELGEYLMLFDEWMRFLQPEDEAIQNPDISDKIESICQKIQKQITAQDRLIVFIKFLEFMEELAIHENGKQTMEINLMSKYIQVFKNVFNPPEQEFLDARAFISDPFAKEMNLEHLLVIDDETGNVFRGFKHLQREHLNGQILILFVPSVRTLICRYAGHDEMYLNGHNVPPYRSFIFTNGAILKNQKINPVYYADAVAQFLQQEKKVKIEFTTKEIEYHFPDSTNGIHPFSFTASSGELIGVMGGSGVGKSTLLNVLNGNLKLNNGYILINGYDIEADKEKLQGIVGFVPQDDLLIEELSVFKNLYYNAKLCFRDFTEQKLISSVMRVLSDIDLIDIKNMTVGDPINKYISGGQRKRLNIALELIREPSVLFADEPTSGLSSMDSEVVMHLLKEQTLKGRLVIVNIHQPSSDIYKLFDKLLIMDKGGFPVYYGNPIDAITYFKSASSHVNPNESECQNCGHVNPEQLLQIIEAKIVNEYGRFTGNRKTAPKDWYEMFRQNIQLQLEIREEKSEVPKSFFKIPGIIQQFAIFSIRNLLSKITNRQYLLINLMEAPLLAAILAYLTRYGAGGHYIFSSNRNLVPYLFMSVVVSLFLGMMVSAEEIIRDRRILKREAFLHLSRFSYLNSKIILLFSLSAIQTLQYVLIGNMILGIYGMTFSYWMILFAASCFANMVGLNISAGLNSVVAIYILIPFILVPQLLLSGTIVAFDNLNPAFTSQVNVPVVGDLMTSRWTFEALAVEQFSNNKYEKLFFPYDEEISRYSFKTSFLIPALKSKLDECRRNIEKNEKPERTASNIAILKNEIHALKIDAGFSSDPFGTGLDEKSLNDVLVQHTKSYLDSLSLYYSALLDRVTVHRDATYEKMVANMGSERVYRLKQDYYNEDLANLVMNKGYENKIAEIQNRLIQKKDPVFMEPVSHNGRAHFYAPVKILGHWKINTFWFNIVIIWIMSFVLYLTLLRDSLRKTIGFVERIRFKKSHR